MSDTHDFPTYFRRAMETAGYPTASALGRASGVDNNAISRWLRGGAPSVELLRQVAPYVRIPLRDLLIKSGIVTAEEIGLDEEPALRPTLEDDIRADPRYTEERKELLIRMLRELSDDPKIVRKQQGQDDESAD